MKKIFLFSAIFLGAIYLAFPWNTNFKTFDPNTCENLAVDVYYYTLGTGGTWQEANSNFHSAYTSCCFNYPNDCGGLVNVE